MLNNLLFDWSGTLATGLEHQAAGDLLPHALEFLQFCHQTRRRIFLLSAIQADHFAKQSSRLGVVHFFERACVGIIDKRQEIAQILVANDFAANETAFIGSTVEDMESARAAGVTAVATLTGSDSRDKLFQAEPDVIVRDLGELQNLMERATDPDEIVIKDLELHVRIGVLEEERALPQRLTVTLRLQAQDDFRELGDDLEHTVDYATVCTEIENFVTDRRDRLIETLADALALHLLARFALARVEIELRKFVLPQTKFVAVRLARHAVGFSRGHP